MIIKGNNRRDKRKERKTFFSSILQKTNLRKKKRKMHYRVSLLIFSYRETQDMTLIASISVTFLRITLKCVSICVARVLLARALRSSQKLSRIIFNRRTPANEIRGERAWRREVYYLIYSSAYAWLRYANIQRWVSRCARDITRNLPPPGRK